MHRLLYQCAFVASFVACVGVANARIQREEKPLDKEFLIKTVTCNQADLKASELVESRTSNAKVKDFAQKMAREHAKANQKLAEVAKDQKVAVLAGTEQQTKDLLDRLSKLQSPELDREYLKAMIDDNQKAINMFEWQTKQGTDTKLNAFASDALPQLRDHLKEAQKVAAEINRQ